MLPIHAAGYVGIAVLVSAESSGAPVPGETSVVAAAVLASRGQLSLPLVIAVAAVSAIVGDNVGYVIGRRGGRRLLARPGRHEASRQRLLARGEAFFERHGATAVFFARWVPGLRTAGAWLAGAARMRWRRFLLWNALGGVTWAVSVGLAAYVLGRAATAAIGATGLVALGLVVVLAVVVRGAERRARVVRTWSGVRAALGRAYTAGITGLAAMVAFNLLLSLFPLALLALFVSARLLGSPSLEESTLRDLIGLFPSASASSLRDALTQLRNSSLTLGIAGTAGALWTSLSFWGALDTSFCRIYRLPCRGWLAQKRFALLMVFATLALVTTTVAVPTLQSIVLNGTHDLPLGLARVPRLAYVISLVAGHLGLLGLFALVYWLVPHGRVPRRAIWPGAVVATALASAVGVAFPIYLTRASTVAHLGSSVAFGFVALLWFYAQALSLLVGAVVNAGRLPGGVRS